MNFSANWISLFFFFNDPAPTEFYPLSLPDALPICHRRSRRSRSWCPRHLYTRSLARSTVDSDLPADLEDAVPDRAHQAQPGRHGVRVEPAPEIGRAHV